MHSAVDLSRKRVQSAASGLAFSHEVKQKASKLRQPRAGSFSAFLLVSLTGFASFGVIGPERPRKRHNPVRPGQTCVRS